jgi:hypothetical protein
MKPDERDTDIERLLNGLQPPLLPPELRSRVLRAARNAEAAPDLWSRIWNHGGLRLAWMAGVVLLLAGHVFIGSGNGPAIDPDLAADNRIDEYVAEFLRPARISDDVKPILGLFAEGSGLSDLELEGNPS